MSDEVKLCTYNVDTCPVHGHQQDCMRQQLVDEGVIIVPCPAWADGQHCYEGVRELFARGGDVIAIPLTATTKRCACGKTVARK